MFVVKIISKWITLVYILNVKNQTQELHGVIIWNGLYLMMDFNEGGFANIFSANWLDREPDFDEKHKERTEPVTVALKKPKKKNETKKKCKTAVRDNYSPQTEDKS